MPIDERLTQQVRAAAAQITLRQQDLNAARGEFQRTVRALYLAGGSLREIADALDVSHQRVHQLLNLPAQQQTRRRGRRRHDLVCSFCSRAQAQVGRLICGPGVGICNDCVALAAGVDQHRGPATDSRTSMRSETSGRCSFCSRHVSNDDADGVALAQADTGTATICTECLGLCDEILTEEPA